MGVWIVAVLLAAALLIGFPFYASIISVPVLLVRMALGAFGEVTQLEPEFEEATD